MKWMSDRPILITVETLGAVLKGQMLSMSPTSAILKPDEPLLLYNKVRTSVRFRFADILYSLSGTAVSSEEDESFFFDFDDVTRKDMAMLRALGIASEQVCEPEASVRPVRRKRTRDEQRHVLHQGPPGGVERRRDPRMELEAQARLLVVEAGVMMNCTLLEISASGCRLYSEKPFQLQQDAHVEVEFVGLGYPFRLAAEVRLKGEEHVVGMRFTAMSTRCSERLKDLMDDLKEINSRRIF